MLNLRHSIKKIEIIILLITVLVNVSSKLLAQNHQLKFTGTVIDSEKQENYDKIIVEYNSDNGFFQTGRHLIYPKIESDGSFEFELPDLNKPYKLHMVIYNSNASKTLWVNEYYTEPTDNVKMKIVLIKDKKSDSTIFTGIGVEKYNLIPKLTNQYWHEYYRELDLLKLDVFKDSTELDLKMDKLAELIKKYESKKSSLINATHLNSEMKNIISYEYAGYYWEWPFRSDLLCKKFPNYRNQIVRKYSIQSEHLFYKPNNVSELCPHYLTYLSVRNAFEMKISNDYHKVNINDFYNNIKNSYSGAIRDRLIGVFTFENNTISKFEPHSYYILDSLLKDASEVVMVPYVKKAIKDKIFELSKVNEGSKVFDSEFDRPNGKKFLLKSLRGKVFLIDAWFTGCAGCAIFHGEFERKIYPMFKDNKDFAVLSINFDLYKERWLKGMSNDLYTSEDYINVHTGKGVGLDHPFMKYYDIKGGPYLMLIDANGDISYVPQIYNVSEMTAMIKKALERIKNNTK